MKYTDLDWFAYKLYLDAVNEIKNNVRNNIPVRFIIDDYFVGKLDEFIEYHKKISITASIYYDKAKIKLRKKKVSLLMYIVD